jgi:hypothetical protein
MSEEELEPMDDMESDTPVAEEKPDMDYIGSSDESAMRSLASREKLRKQMEMDMQRFLNQGGKVQEIADNVMGDPPRKPQSNYGSRPI